MISHNETHNSCESLKSDHLFTRRCLWNRIVPFSQIDRHSSAVNTINGNSHTIAVSGLSDIEAPPMRGRFSLSPCHNAGCGIGEFAKAR